MSIRKRIVLVLFAATLVNAFVIPTAAEAAPNDAGNACDAAAQQSGDCLGFSAYAGQNEYVAAVANALASGHTQQAQRFVSKLHGVAAEAARTALASALDATSPADASKAVSTLYSTKASSAARASTTQATPAVTAPAQARNGETAAVGYYNWLLHDSYNVPVYYGECSSYSGSCTTYGSWDFTLTANTTDVGDNGMLFSSEIAHRSGVSATLSGVSVRLCRDVTGGGDTYEATLPCPTSGSSFSCTKGTKSGNVVGHWYYLELNITTHPSGHAASTFQVQTRRYKNVSPQIWQFLSYQYFNN